MKQFFFVCSIIGMVGWTILFSFLGLMSCAGMASSVSHTTDPYATAGAGIGMMLGGGFLLFVWFVGFVAMGIFALICKPSKEDKLLKELQKINAASDKQILEDRL